MSQILQLRSAAVSISANGDNSVIAGVSGRVIKVWKMWLTSTGAVNLLFYDGLAGTVLSGNAVLTAAGSSFFAQYDGSPYWICSPGNAFNINLSGAIAVSGQVMYTLG